MNKQLLPNLFIIGAAKSGTTSLHHHLGGHPDIFMSTPKEPGYFAREMTNYPKDLEWYLSLFVNAGSAKIIGESSTHYTKLPVYHGVAEHIAEICPTARFIYLMRDPVMRTISHYWHHVRQFAEHRPIMTAIQKDIQYIACSDYSMQLKPYFERFGRDRVYLITFEEFVRRPKASIHAILAWLGVSTDASLPLLKKKNEMPKVFNRSKGLGLLHRFRYSDFWTELSPHIPKPLKDYAKRFALEPVTPRTEPIDEVISYLRPIMVEKVRDVTALLGREFPEWSTTNGTTPKRTIVE